MMVCLFVLTEFTNVTDRQTRGTGNGCGMMSLDVLGGSTVQWVVR